MVKYRDVYLAKNSVGYELWLKKDFKALDKHIKLLDKKEQELLARYKQEL